MQGVTKGADQRLGARGGTRTAVLHALHTLATRHTRKRGGGDVHYEGLFDRNQHRALEARVTAAVGVVH